MRRRTTVIAGLVAAAALVAGSGAALAGESGSGVRTEVLSVAGVPEPDGTAVRLDATL